MSDVDWLELAHQILPALVKGTVKPEEVHPGVIEKLPAAMHLQNMQKPFAQQLEEEGRLPPGVIEQFLNRP